MKLQSGARVGPYEITGNLGSGGMGEVYRARDTRLDRSVAIKVLSATFAGHSDLRARFEREARVISQLNHPNICTLYDVGREDDTDYLVMELIEGESLADRLVKGPLGMGDVLKHGAQIADALARAHRQGITHRDLKPGNVMLTKSGAKLLDFGLAKTLTAARPASAPEDATQHKPLTQEGTVLGTFQYMAPEQLAGEEADARTDIFAFGCVLYEMSTGQRAFQGKTKTSLIAAIVGGEPRPLRDLQPLTPPALEHVIERCLEKEPDDRWQSAHDIAAELNWISETDPRTSRQIRPRSKWPWVAAALFAVALAGGAFLAGRNRSEVDSSSTAASLLPPPGTTYNGQAAVSPDGAQIVVPAGSGGGRTALWIRQLGAFDWRRLDGTEGASYPFWSPDGQSVAFFDSSALRRLSMKGGAVQTICPVRRARGGAWAPDGTILFAPDMSESIWRVSASGGTPTRVTTLAPGEFSHRWPAFFGDGRRFLYFSRGRRDSENPQPYGIWSGSLDSTERKLIVRASSNASFVAPHFLAFFDQGNLVVQKIDSRNGILTGEKTVLTSDVDFFKALDTASFSISPGTFLFRDSRQVRRQLAEVDRAGNKLRTIGEPAYLDSARLSPDGERTVEIHFDPRTREQDLFIRDLKRGADVRLTNEPAVYEDPIWSPDGKQLIYGSSVSGLSDLYRLSVGTGDRVKIVQRSSSYAIPSDWSNDGEWLLYAEIDSNTGWDLWLLNVRAGGPPIRFVQTRATENDGAFSPDGKWIAYTSDESGAREVYLRLREGGAAVRITTTGGAAPRWRNDGRELYYVSRGALMAVDIDATSEVEAGPPRVLFAAAGLSEDLNINSYSPTAGGKSFIMTMNSEEVNPHLLNVITNWQDRLR